MNLLIIEKPKFKKSNIRTIMKYILSYLSFILPQEKKQKFSFNFSRFERMYLKQSLISYDDKTVKKCNSKYRLFICGSDQIWAPNVFDPIYFLSFVDYEKPKIAYALALVWIEFQKNLK